MSKPKIALLERDAKDWGPEEMLPLLRLARAAKNWHRLPMLKHERELRAALDAFDWSE